MSIIILVTLFLRYFFFPFLTGFILNKLTQRKWPILYTIAAGYLCFWFGNIIFRLLLTFLPFSINNFSHLSFLALSESYSEPILSKNNLISLVIKAKIPAVLIAGIFLFLFN